MPIATNLRQAYVSREIIAQSVEGLLATRSGYTIPTLGVLTQTLPAAGAFTRLLRHDGNPIQLSLSATTEHFIMYNLRFNFSTTVTQGLTVYARANSSVTIDVQSHVYPPIFNTGGLGAFVNLTGMFTPTTNGTQLIEFLVAGASTATLYYAFVNAYAHTVRMI